MRLVAVIFALACLLCHGAPAWCQQSPLDRLDPRELTPEDRVSFPPSAVALIPHAKGAVTIDTAFSADGKRLACARSDNTIEFWDLSGAKPKQQGTVNIEDEAGRVSRVAFSRDGAWIASAHAFPAKKVRLWKLTEEGELRPSIAHAVTRSDNLAFHPNSKMLVFGSNEGHVMEITDKGPVYRGDRFPNANSSFTFTRDGASFVSVVFNPEPQRRTVRLGAQVLARRRSQGTAASPTDTPHQGARAQPRRQDAGDRLARNDGAHLGPQRRAADLHRAVFAGLLDQGDVLHAGQRTAHRDPARQ